MPSRCASPCCIVRCSALALTVFSTSVEIHALVPKRRVSDITPTAGSWRRASPMSNGGAVPPRRCAQTRCVHFCFPRAGSAWRTPCRLGPPVLRRRRTFDRRIERCAPAVPQHDRARTSAIPLPAHRPCAAASQQSLAAIVPHGDVGCLVGFRQEGRHFWSIFDRSVVAPFTRGHHQAEASASEPLNQ